MVRTLETTTVTIDREFRDLCPPLTEEELRHLETLICEGGCDPVVYWENSPDKSNPVVDGHTRHTICQRKKIPMPTRGKSFKDRGEVMAWILKNQLGRRNLSDASRSIARGRLYNMTKGKREENLKKGKTPADSPKAQNARSESTADKIAEEYNVDPATVRRDGQLAEAVDIIESKAPALVDAIEQHDIPRSAAEALSELPKAGLRALAKKIEGGAEPKEAVKEAIQENKPPVKKPRQQKPAKNGDSEWSAKDFKDVYEALGHILPKLGLLNRKYKSSLYQKSEAAVKEAMRAVDAWKKETQP